MDVNKHRMRWIDNEKLFTRKFVGQTDVSSEPEVLPTEHIKFSDITVSIKSVPFKTTLQYELLITFPPFQKV